MAYKTGPTGLKVKVVNQSKGQAPPRDTRGIKQRVTDAVSGVVRSIPTGVNFSKGRAHTVGDATDELRQYKMKKGKK